MRLPWSGERAKVTLTFFHPYGATNAKPHAFGSRTATFGFWQIGMEALFAPIFAALMIADLTIGVKREPG